jgi:hypothetical protein
MPEYLDEKQIEKSASRIMDMPIDAQRFIIELLLSTTTTKELKGIEIIFEKWEKMKNILAAKEDELPHRTKPRRR